MGRAKLNYYNGNVQNDVIYGNNRYTRTVYYTITKYWHTTIEGCLQLFSSLLVSVHLLDLPDKDSYCFFDHRLDTTVTTVTASYLEKSN